MDISYQMMKNWTKDVSLPFFISIILASTLFSTILVNLNFLNEPRYYSAYPIILRDVLYLVGSINLIFLLPLIFSVIFILRMGIISYLDNHPFLNFYTRGISNFQFMKLITREFYLIVLIGIFIGTLLGSIISGLFSITSTVEERLLGYIFPYSISFPLWWIIPFLSVFPLIILPIFLCLLVAEWLVIRQFKRYLSFSSKSDIPSSPKVISAKMFISKNQKFFIIGITCLTAIIGLYFTISTILAPQWQNLFNQLISGLSSLEFFFNLLPFIVVLTPVEYYLIRHQKLIYQRFCLELHFLLLNGFISNEMALVTLFYSSNTALFIKSITFDSNTLLFAIYIGFAILAFIELMNNRMYGFFGIFAILGIFIAAINVFDDFFLLLLSVFALSTLLLGITNISYKAIEKIYRPFQSLLKSFLGRSQGFIAPHLISRRSFIVKANLAFLVITSIMGLLTNGSYPVSLAVTVDESYWLIGADIKLQLSQDAQWNTIPSTNAQYIYEYSEVLSVTRVYVSKYFYSHGGNTNDAELTEVVFIEPSLYSTTAFTRDDWFIGGTAQSLFARLENEPYTIILDAVRAQELKKGIGDDISLQFAGGLTMTARIIGLVNYFNLGYATNNPSKPHFGVMNFESLMESTAKNPTSCYLIKTRATTSPPKLLQALLTDSRLKYIDMKNSLTIDMAITRLPNSQRLNAAPQTLGSLAYTCLMITVIGFAVFNISVSREDQKDYYLLKVIGMDNRHIYYVTISENILKTIIILSISYVTAMFISLTLYRLFFPTTNLPQLFTITPAVIIYQILFVLLFFSSAIISGIFRARKILSLPPNHEEIIQ